MQTGLQWAPSWVRGTYDMIINLECSNYVTQLVLRCFLVMMIIVAGYMMKRSYKTDFTTRARKGPAVPPAGSPSLLVLPAAAVRKVRNFLRTSLEPEKVVPDIKRLTDSASGDKFLMKLLFITRPKVLNRQKHQPSAAPENEMNPGHCHRCHY
jgi:hypothetical protein